jgi:hypothetical protein
MTRTILLHMPNGGVDGVINAWFQGDRSHVEFRGQPYHLWSSNENTPMARVHDAMEGMHSTVLHTDDVLALLPRHPDYEVVREMLEAE